MAVVLSSPQSVEATKMLVDLIKADKAKAIEFVVFAGRTEEEAVAYVDAISQAIEVSAAKDRLKGYGEDLQSVLQGTLDEFLEAFPVDEVIEEMKVEVKFSRAEVPDKPGEIIGGLVAPTRMRLQGEERLKATSTGGNGGGGGRSRVPVPQSVKDAGCNSWVAWFRQEHLEEAATKDAGASYSAPRALEEVKDATYLAAKAEADTK